MPGGRRWYHVILSYVLRQNETCRDMRCEVWALAASATWGAGTEGACHVRNVWRRFLVGDGFSHKRAQQVAWLGSLPTPIISNLRVHEVSVNTHRQLV